MQQSVVHVKHQKPGICNILSTDVSHVILQCIYTTQVMTATGSKWYNKNTTYWFVTECSVHHDGLYIYKNVQNKLYHTVACDARQQKSLQSDSSSHTDHFTHWQFVQNCIQLHSCVYSSHTCNLVFTQLFFYDSSNKI